jgi:hypothetical protein
MSADLVSVSRHLEQALGVPPLIRCNGKAPLDPGWTTGPRTDPDGWRDRLVGHEQNVGMLTGHGVVVIDVDLYHPDAEGSLDRLRELGLSTETVTAITGGGGRHYLYSCDEPIRSGPLAGFPGIDIKAEGGQIIVAPSIHPDTGVFYEWEDGWAAGDVERLELPHVVRPLFASGGEAQHTRTLDERDEAAVTILLERFSGHHPRVRAGWVEVCRPGKDDGCSATIGKLGPGTVKVWSSNWPGLPAGVYSGHELRQHAGITEPKVASPPLRPPEGFRWWEPGDAETLRPPELGADAYHGLVGEYLDLVRGRTEADPAPIGFNILAHVGVHFGRLIRYFAGDAIVQFPNLWGAVVGPTSAGGKGVADSTAAVLLNAIDPYLRARHTFNGFGSGEALIYAVRDDEGVEKRRLVHDQELAAVFRVCLREGSTLSEILRKAFDGDTLESHTRTHGDVVATAVHVAALGSITADELIRLMDVGSIRNGLGNRWLYLWAELVDVLPFGATIDSDEVRRIANALAERMIAADNLAYRIERESDAGKLWDEWYRARRRGVGTGIIADLTARHHVHAARLAIIYAALDGAGTIELAHLKAALSWVDYSLATTQLVFGSAWVGNVRRLLEAIRHGGSDGLDGTAQHDVFQRHLNAGAIEELRGDLEARRLIHTVTVPTNGRPRIISYAISPLPGLRTSESSEESHDHAARRTPDSLDSPIRSPPDHPAPGGHRRLARAATRLLERLRGRRVGRRAPVHVAGRRRIAEAEQRRRRAQQGAAARPAPRGRGGRLVWRRPRRPAVRARRALHLRRACDGHPRSAHHRQRHRRRRDQDHGQACDRARALLVVAVPGAMLGRRPRTGPPRRARRRHGSADLRGRGRPARHDVHR